MRRFSGFAQFDYKDALNVESQLTEDEVMIRDMANSYAQQELMPRILTDNRNEDFDVSVM
eukprot:CAMPEP_0205819612 /NCGR_PEP_ID=MMETSP0206-20130828/2060_1 /ASSEMBLY_ACC=CAM_ASM_000279 /TAXON_ID=36767 /ORGANISM="Euplotes focardii, Strain TN1" /LENGTH=59 /DNA_ID=CAMNT_0053113411 /DNA_START=90 /DNA_END=266 /DNA_ORIENTATION=+